MVNVSKLNIWQHIPGHWKVLSIIKQKQESCTCAVQYCNTWEGFVADSTKYIQYQIQI